MDDLCGKSACTRLFVSAARCMTRPLVAMATSHKLSGLCRCRRCQIIRISLTGWVPIDQAYKTGATPGRIVRIKRPVIRLMALNPKAIAHSRLSPEKNSTALISCLKISIPRVLSTGRTNCRAWSSSHTSST